MNCARRNSRWLGKNTPQLYGILWRLFSVQKLDILKDKQVRVTPAPWFLTFEFNSRETSWCTYISLVICKSQCCTSAWLSGILLHFQILWTKSGFKFYTYNLHIYSEFLSQLAVSLAWVSQRAGYDYNFPCKEELLINFTTCISQSYCHY